MIFALGFLVSGLLWLLFLPAFWRRALRLSTRRLEMLMPLSMEEALAERDQIRARAALDQRRIEQRLEAERQSRARDMLEVTRRAAMQAQRESEIESLAADLRAREAELLDAWAQLGSMHVDAHDLESRLAQAQQDHAAAERLREAFDSMRIEKAALETQVDSLQVQDQDLRARVRSLQFELRQVELRDDAAMARTAAPQPEPVDVDAGPQAARIEDVPPHEAPAMDRIHGLRANAERHAAVS
jgi:chromosome segregation ATPase